DPQVKTCSAYEKTGMKEIWESIVQYRELTAKNGYFISNRNAQSLFWMFETIDEQLKSGFYNNEGIKAKLKIYEKKILNAQISSFEAARQLLEIYSTLK
ncbi:MAG: methylmalonyl Co-A mutase-associated GTPase MeaB, partial [Prolixibacteraceae bacterium]|nr:methylmalonyl Co-A mutase-associated GTPase MeaB [Prolixibacteraceae bacterium]